MQDTQFFTPAGLLIGSKEVGSFDHIEAAYNALSFSFNTEEVAFIAIKSGDYVRYAGAPSACFVDIGAEALSQVSIALSSEDGVFIIDEGKYSLLIQKEGEAFSSRSGSYDEVREICSDEELDFQVLERDEELSAKWVTMSYHKTRKVKKLNQRVSVVSGLVALAMGVVWVGGSILTGTLTKSAQSYDYSVKQHLDEAIKSIPVNHPVDYKISKLQALKAVATKSGGWINEFKVEKGQVGFSMEMPYWVTNEYVAPLGKVTSEKNPKNQTIVYTKTIKNEGK